LPLPPFLPNVSVGAQLGGRGETGVAQMPRGAGGQRLEPRLPDPGMPALELHDQLLRALPLQAQVAARGTATADDRQLTFLRVARHNRAVGSRRAERRLTRVSSAAPSAHPQRTK